MQSSPLIGRKRNFLESQKDNIHSHFSASPANKRHKTHHRSSSVDINSNHNVNVNNNNMNKSFISRKFGNNTCSKSGPASFEFGDNNPKERGFQDHSEKFQKNSMKNRQKTIYEQRKLNRKRVLQENYQRASLKNKMKQPQYWEFNIFEQKNNINSNINDDDNKYNQNMFGSDDYDSDELMSEYPMNDNYQNQANENMKYFATNNNPPNMNNNNNGFNAYQQYQYQSQWNPPRPARHNFIPKTCPNLHKYSSKFDRNRSYYNQDTNYRTNNVNDFDRNQNNNNHHQQSDVNQNNIHHQQQPYNYNNVENVHHQMHGNENENENENDNAPMTNDLDNDQNEPYQSNNSVDDGEMEDMEDMEESKMDYNEEQKIEEKENIPINNSIDNNNNQNENVSRNINKERRKLEQEELVRRRGQQRIEEMKNEQIKQKNEDAMRNELREKIHPKIIRKAHLVKNNPIALIKLFYPKTRLNSNASDKRKEVLKAFKRALANFHPDRTINKSIPEQIEAEEIFKLLSKEKENFENKYNGNNYNNNSHHNSNSYHRYNDFNNNNRHQRHGWF